eukprot:gb/GEZN01000778.1/.p1 GENE.gb/GEZN01000778.1/~~gb/GEZN01000778.1/.p1  ORF type:complete len:662 (+),score=126.15 gb/GEZN01000778.1/:1671-3656(+)
MGSFVSQQDLSDYSLSTLLSHSILPPLLTLFLSPSPPVRLGCLRTLCVMAQQPLGVQSILDFIDGVVPADGQSNNTEPTNNLASVLPQLLQSLLGSLQRVDPSSLWQRGAKSASPADKERRERFTLDLQAVQYVVLFVRLLGGGDGTPKEEAAEVVAMEDEEDGDGENVDATTRTGGSTVGKAKIAEAGTEGERTRVSALNVVLLRWLAVGRSDSKDKRSQLQAANGGAAGQNGRTDGQPADKAEKADSETAAATADTTAAAEEVTCSKEELDESCSLVVLGHIHHRLKVLQEGAVLLGKAPPTPTKQQLVMKQVVDEICQDLTSLLSVCHRHYNTSQTAADLEVVDDWVTWPAPRPLAQLFRQWEEQGLATVSRLSRASCYSLERAPVITTTPPQGFPVVTVTQDHHFFKEGLFEAPVTGLLSVERLPEDGKGLPSHASSLNRAALKKRKQFPGSNKRRDSFRTRKSGSGRAPSKHVDDFMTANTLGAPPKKKGNQATPTVLGAPAVSNQAPLPAPSVLQNGAATGETPPDTGHANSLEPPLKRPRGMSEGGGGGVLPGGLPRRHPGPGGAPLGQQGPLIMGPPPMGGHGDGPARNGGGWQGGRGGGRGGDGQYIHPPQGPPLVRRGGGNPQGPGGNLMRHGPPPHLAPMGRGGPRSNFR